MAMCLESSLTSGARGQGAVIVTACDLLIRQLGLSIETVSPLSATSLAVATFHLRKPLRFLL